MKKYLLPICFLLLFLPSLYAQQEVPVLGRQELINGFSRAISGEVLPYFSVYPKYAREALLTRCTDGKKSIEWETDTIPSNWNKPEICFTWIAAHSTGTNSGDRNFDLFVNDEYRLSFTTHKKNYPAWWSFGSTTDSARLVFEFKTRDGADDAHGMAYLRLPMKGLEKGRPVKIKVVGKAMNSNDWYMTFKYAFKERMDISALPFLLKTAKGEKQLLKFTVLHFGDEEMLNYSIDNKTYTGLPVKNGFQVFEIPVELVTTPTIIKIKAGIGQHFQLEKTVQLRPVREMEIDLVHHSHTDIGYSHIQEEVIDIHIKNIREAIRLANKTASYPEGSRFIWNIESSWAVENFLKVATETERSSFINAVKKGQIVISGSFANVLTGLATPEELNWIMEYSAGLKNNYGLPIKTGFMTDIPGMSWSMVDALTKNGIRYFSNGPNYVEALPDKGDRIGHILSTWGDKPFWWKSTNGKDSILYWTCAKGYSSWHGLAPGVVKDRGPDKIAEYLDELDAKQYPYSMVQWRYNIGADNGPTDSTISDFVRDWNQRYASPVLVIANVNELFERFEKKYGKQLPVYSGDLTPYWEDGAYSTAKEEGKARMLSQSILQIEKLANKKNIKLDPNSLYQAKRAVVLFHEHTWGSWNSTSDPDAAFTTHQWNYKKAYLDTGARYLFLLQKEVSLNLKESPKLASPIKIRYNKSVAITSLEYGGKQWVDSSRYGGLAELIYVKGTDPQHHSFSKLQQSSDQNANYELTGDLEGCLGVFNLINFLSPDIMHISVIINKKAIRDKESIHIALPFAIPNARVRIGMSDTIIGPGFNQLPGSNHDFYSVQKWIDVSDQERGVTISCPQGALFEIGEMINENKVNNGYKKWKDRASTSSTLFLYALNNYWHTNYKADQEGLIRFDVYLQFHGPFSLKQAQQFAQQLFEPYQDIK